MTETQGWVLIAIVAIIALSGGMLLRLVLIAMDQILSKIDQVHGEVIQVRLATDELLSVTHIMESQRRPGGGR